MSTPRTEHGVVDRFDAAAGVGLIRDDAGELVEFHCVSITDGSRHTTEGRSVAFRRRLGPTGRVEAVAVTPT